MDLRNLSTTPNQLDSVPRRTSLSSLSSSGYASSSYGGGNSTPQLPSLRLTGSGFKNGVALQNSWLNPTNTNSTVGPWVEQQSSLNMDGKLIKEEKKSGSNSASNTSNTTKSSTSTTNSGAATSNSSGTIVNNNANSTSSTAAANDASNSSSGKFSDDDDDELIPTAIVIKNIPFAIKKEQLLDVMTKLNLPLPYAFNYHFDNGVFRGLAFANFTSTDEASLVVNQLNGREIGGRKLRVEYKKMLPLQERERIEREKKEKRGQLEEQHRSNSNASLASLLSAASTTAATKNLSVNGGGSNSTERLFINLPISSNLNTPPIDLNLNDPETLDLYTQLVLYRDDVSKLVFELAISTSGLSLSQRKVLSVLCSFLGLLELFDNGFIIIRRKPGHVVQGVNQSSQSPQPPSHSTSMLNLAQHNQINSSSGQPDLLRSQSQSALPMSRMRQQTSTPIQQNFPQYQQGQGSSGSGQSRPFSQIQSFGMYQQQPQQSVSNTPSQLGSSSAAALLRSSNNRSYVDVRSTPPLANNFNQQNSQGIIDSPLQQQLQLLFHGLSVNSQPSTPLTSNDISSRFQPFANSHLSGSFNSLQQSNQEEMNNNDSLNNQFHSLNLTNSNNYDSSMGIWGQK